VIVPLLALALLTSCQSFKDKSDETKLNKLLKAYEETLRWGTLQNIYNFLDPDLREQSVAPDYLDIIKVTKVRRLTQIVPISETSVKLTIAIDYVFEDQQVERTLVDEQVWEHRDKSGEWFRINPIPGFE
jgi:hypothetical protein